MAVTDRQAVVISGLQASPIRIDRDTPLAVTDSGNRRTMRTVVAGRLAAVEMTSPALGEEPRRFLVHEKLLGHLQDWLAS